MKLPKMENPQRYSGLYIVDFGDHSGVGFLAEEVAELLESEQYAHITIYKIHRAYPDGTLEIRGVRRETFQLESGMFFYAEDENTARGDYDRLAECPKQIDPPARAKLHLAQLPSGQYLTALIYPAEYEEEFGRWLLDCEYRTAGPAAGGISQVELYYRQNPTVLERKQLFNSQSVAFRGQMLLEAAKKAVVR
ncbi:MAG TPA: hypothetical protein PK054_12770 [Anaerohalosphaeraceae bacterium]|nr:hypothetical protein [Anaerohalosphaeraceae bacterium]HOL88241.1 hypothetical protein [Anaerohalosphaeraceae bacterium]HPP57439.1 hypothetical protein [Anaerohalosphaeraceae bacterium]